MASILIELTETEAERLKAEAKRLGIEPTEFARAAVADLLAEPDEQFDETVEALLQRNHELYRRLA